MARFVRTRPPMVTVCQLCTQWRYRARALGFFGSLADCKLSRKLVALGDGGCGKVWRSAALAH
jgi:hypothetical protein